MLIGNTDSNIYCGQMYTVPCILVYWIKLKQASGFDHSSCMLHMCSALLQVAVFFRSNFPSLIHILHTMFYFSSKDQLPQKLEIMSCFHV